MIQGGGSDRCANRQSQRRVVDCVDGKIVGFDLDGNSVSLLGSRGDGYCIHGVVCVSPIPFCGIGARCVRSDIGFRYAQ